MATGIDSPFTSRDRRESAEIPDVSWSPISVVAGIVAVVLLATSGRIGYYGDELYFLASGRHHLSWGYADQPWLLPVLARSMDTLLPGSVVGMRLPATIVTASGVVVAALLARELGGARRAQLLTALAYGFAFQILTSGHILATSTLDPFFWTVVCFLVVRWVRTRSDALLLLAGATTAIALQGKYLIAFLWAAIALAALIAGPRNLLGRPALWAGGLLAAVVTAPSLVWQAEHDWPFFDMQTAVSSEVEAMFGGREMFVPTALLFAGVIGAVLCCHGLWVLLRDSRFRQYRFLGIAVVLCTVLCIATGGRFYYVAGLYAVLMAASAVRIEAVRPARAWGWIPTLPVAAVSAVIAVVVFLPVVPVSTVTSTQWTASSSLGWPELANTARDAVEETEEPPAAVVTETFWQAGALEVFAHDALPPVYSPERGYYYFGPPASDDPVLVVGYDRSELDAWFSDVRLVGRTNLDAPRPNVNQDVPIWYAEHPRAPWTDLWPRLHRL
ncbi:hypothetical protein CH263_22295 [Rhodococcus sp. 06-1059B-a]|nr:glycosyltransferase family 39 protein [Rhodococcus sp. 06-1059B-a]OZD59824.1 hypothetical protein CH263_22295 [Rhodococcus sp. 06-1059B-a]